MNKNDSFKNQIGVYKTRLLIVVGVLVLVVIGETLAIVNWYKQEKQVRAQITIFELKSPEFNNLWEKLMEKTVPVELGGEIRYGGDMGKLEPFE